MFLFTHTHTPSSSLTGLLPVCTTRVIPAVTALKYRDALTLAVGTSTGQVGVLPTQPCLYQPSHTLPLSSNQLQLVVKLLKALSLPSFPCFCPPPPPHAVFIALLFPLPSLLPMQSSLPSFFALPMQVLLYDLRASTPLLIKDHYYSSPIHSIAFQTSNDLVLSADSKIMKIWNRNDVILIFTT